MKKRLGSIGNIFLSALIFMSMLAGVFSSPKAVAHFSDFLYAGNESPQWHWIFSFDIGPEGAAEEAENSDKEGFSPSTAFESFSRSEIISVADFEKSSNHPTENDHCVRRLFLLFNCLRLDPF